MSNPRIMCVFFIISLLLACAVSRQAEQPLATSGSGIKGQVLIGPMCPAVQQDQACPDKPFAATLIVRDQEGGRDRLQVRSGEDGRFRADLAPGKYTLIPVSPNPGAPPYAESQVVTVEEGRFTSVTVKYDSGIR